MRRARFAPEFCHVNVLKKKTSMKTASAQKALFPRPLSGAMVSRLPSALVPASRAFKGQYVELAPLDAAAHAADLFAASHGNAKAPAYGAPVPRRRRCI